jgi:hypothetical protein
MFITVFMYPGCSGRFPSYSACCTGWHPAPATVSEFNLKPAASPLNQGKLGSHVEWFFEGWLEALAIALAGHDLRGQDNARPAAGLGNALVEQ